MKNVFIRIILPDGTKIESDPFVVSADFKFLDGKSLLTDFAELFFSAKGFTATVDNRHICLSQDMMVESVVSWWEIEGPK